MRNLSQGIVDRTLVDAIINIMQKLDMPEEKCMELLNVPENRQKAYHVKIQDKLQDEKLLSGQL